MFNENYYRSRSNTNKSKIEHFFLPFSMQIEKVLLASLSIFILALLLVQVFLLSGENNHALVNKAVRYEGVFHEDPIEAKATLQRR
jgi:hypothetical protein